MSLFLLMACLPDDPPGSDMRPVLSDSDTGAWVDTGPEDTAAEQGLVGKWLSEGSDISELFAGAPFEYTSITARFKDDDSYKVVGSTAGGDSYTFSGTYVIDSSTSPGSITLSQTQPSTSTAEGIFLVEGDTLTYEIVQVDPDYGYSPPTPEGGFGSTSGPNMTEGINVQIYRRQ
jgi:hypothetical protein